MGFDVRPIRDEGDARAAAAVFRTAMVGLPPLPGSVDLSGLFEPGRAFGAFAGGEVVGATDSYTSWLTVPGGARVPHAAVTHVGVLPTHTRRGVVRELMRAQHEDVAARGEIVASLRASEAGIYERFGYGVAGAAAHRELERRRAVLRATVPSGGSVRLVEAGASTKLLAGIYADVAGWTGAIARPSYWWRLQELRHGGGSYDSYAAVHGEPGAEDGFVRYHPVDTAAWFTSRDRTIIVDDLVAGTSEAYAGLVRFLLGVDLVDRIVFPHLPVDDPLGLLLTDERALRTVGVGDEIWLRLVDVEAALNARTYRGTEEVAVAVTDELLPGNTGTYLVSARGAERTNAPASLSLDVAALSALYLGGTHWWQHARAGRVTEHTPGALAAADALFATPAQPFAGTSF
ncbi:GNAT family N-acetyltransferase [Actinocorallia sp. A-T 12471]|uniref:GNAT family N-acetyltransferase n=1 Tax=Actinocorallia sp. A-T 12471 TaxID=3089813 RepID=UPI0029D00A57|nr:GNAT family N-acetyltransferase [Actinocorallia sp. A-T 12471]MDX6740471.1 GNAT family N-acetyltransferase [Actinocorallia sp. A-T 12471]